MKNVLPILVILTLLILLVTLIPPYSWGDETTILAYKLPLKEYDFIFNPVKKEFIIDNYHISLERHLILSELLLEYLLCLTISTTLYFFYIRFKFKAISFFLYLIFCSITIILWNYRIYDVLLLFRPTYDNVKQKGAEISKKYSDLMQSKGPYMFLDPFKRIYDNNYVPDDHEAVAAWYDIRDNVTIPQNLLPDLNKFIRDRPKPINTENKNRYYHKSDIYIPDEAWEDDNIERVKKYYPNFILAEGKDIDSYALIDSINNITLKYFINSMRQDFDYLTIRTKYFASLNNFTENEAYIKYYGKYILVLFFIVILLLKRKFIINKSAVYIEKFFVENKIPLAKNEEEKLE